MQRLSSLLLLSLLLLVGIVGVVSVPVPYALCSAASAHVKIDSLSANEWGPVKGDTLNVTAVGVVDETVLSGEYTINIKIDGFPLPSINGDIAEFNPLPWPKGPLQFSILEDIPSDAPSGSYTLQVSAVDQNNDQLFCVDLAFKLAVVGEEGTVPTTSATRHGAHHESQPDSIQPISPHHTRPRVAEPPSQIFARRPKLARSSSEN